MAFGGLLGSTSANNASPGTSIATSSGITIAAGDLVIVCVGARSVNLITGGSCTDTQGNTWTRLAYGTNGVQQRMVAYYCVITKAGTSNFTVGWTTSSTGDAAIVVGRYEGPFLASPLDQNPTANEATSATQVSSTTGTLSQADELAIGYFCAANGTTYTQSGSWAIDVSDRTGTGANTASAGIVRQVVSATTALQAAVTGAASVPYAGGIATFKKGASAPFMPQQPFLKLQAVQRSNLY